MTYREVAAPLLAVDHLRRTVRLVAEELQRVRPALEQAAQLVLRYQQASEHRRRVRRQLRRLCRPDLDDAAREEAAVALLRLEPRLLPPRVAGPPRKYRAWRQFADEHKRDPRALLRELLLNGLVVAGREAAESQYVRLGTAWMTDARGRQKKVVPRTLPFSDLLFWLRRRAYKHVEALLPVELVAAVALEPADQRQADNFLRQFRRLEETVAPLTAARGAVAVLGPLPPTASKRQREIYRLTAAGLPTNEIAARLGIAPATVRVHRRNLRRKARRPL